MTTETKNITLEDFAPIIRKFASEKSDNVAQSRYVWYAEDTMGTPCCIIGCGLHEVGVSMATLSLIDMKMNCNIAGVDTLEVLGRKGVTMDADCVKWCENVQMAQDGRDDFVSKQTWEDAIDFADKRAKKGA